MAESTGSKVKPISSSSSRKEKKFAKTGPGPVQAKPAPPSLPTAQDLAVGFLAQPSTVLTSEERLSFHQSLGKNGYPVELVSAENWLTATKSYTFQAPVPFVQNLNREIGLVAEMFPGAKITARDYMATLCVMAAEDPVVKARLVAYISSRRFAQPVQP
jgi:hypothetical protein